jgi:hypothetical protein
MGESASERAEKLTAITDAVRRHADWEPWEIGEVISSAARAYGVTLTAAELASLACYAGTMC